MNIAIVAAKRTAIGKFLGSISHLQATELGSLLVKDLLKSKDGELLKNNVKKVFMGQVLTSGCGQNPARQTALYGGLSNEVQCLTVNQVCGSGLYSVILAASMLEKGEVAIAGGQENMSLAKHAVYIRSGVKSGQKQMTDTMLTDGLIDAFLHDHMGCTAETVAKTYDVHREEQDEYSLSSQTKAKKAIESGYFKNEIVPLTKQDGEVFDTDEFPRFDTNLQTLSKMRPAFDKERGTVTAGNSSGINDGAAVVALCHEDFAKANGLKILAKIKSFANVGLDPKIMGMGSGLAAIEALKKAKWTINDLDLIEANEAFASQAVAVNELLGWDKSKVNINGGAIALGHPIGASGCRCLVTLLHSMHRVGASKGIVSLCIGGGMGVAMCVER